MSIRRFSALTCTLLFGFGAGLAQNSVTPVRWSEGASNASPEVKNDVKIEGLQTDDLHVFVSLADVKETEYNRVWMQLVNHGKTPISFDPQSTLLLHGEKTVRPEVPDKAANSIQKVGEAKSQELSSAHCNLMMTGQQKGTSACQPTDTQVQTGKKIGTLSAQQAQWVRDKALKSSTIAPGEQAQGAIVFRKEKKPTDYVFRMSIGTEVLEFPVNAQNKAPSYD